MASTFAVTRNHLIFGLCLPIALLLGYLLADAQDPMTIFAIGVAFVVLTIPLTLKWYHPLLLFCWNMGANPALPGRPALWAVMAFIAFLVAVLNRSINEDSRLAPVPKLTLPLLAILGVVLGTAVMTGGIGLGVFRSGTVGGKNYFYLVAAIIGYFALASRTIPIGRAKLYVALFFLPALLALVGTVAARIGPAAGFVSVLYPMEFEMAANNLVGPVDERVFSAGTAASMVLFWLLARVGVRGIFDYTKFWRALIFVFLFYAAAFGGFRSIAIYMMLAFAILFCLEGLWRTRLMAVTAVILFLGGALLAGFVDKLPYSVQRSLSFLPLEVDPEVKMSADTSTEWRVEMWREAVKQVPDYLFKGKGYTTTADEMYMVNFSMLAGHSRNWEWALLSGDYHNGPLSLIIPFGIYGLLAFLWLIVVGVRFLYRAYRDGPPELRTINALLFACFLARSIFFLTVYGAIAHDLFIFTGILGLSVALNVPHRSKTEPQSPTELEPSPQI